MKRARSILALPFALLGLALAWLGDWLVRVSQVVGG
jgi:hypothetical protein